MIIPISKLYEGQSLTRTTLNLAYWRADVTGTIKSVFVYCGSYVAVGASVFNLRINGTSQWTGDNRLSIGAGNNATSKTGLNIAVSRGDVMILDLEQSAQSGTGAPIQIVVLIDDGVSSGADSAEEISVDDSGFTNIEGGDVQEVLADIDSKIGTGSGSSSAIDNLFSIDAKPNSDFHPFSDYFGDESETLANSTAFQGANHRFLIDGGRAKLILPSAATEISTGRFWELPGGDCTIIAKVWNYAEKLNYANVGICLFQDAAANPNTCDYISLRAEKLATDYRLAVAYYTSYTTPSAYIGSQTSLDAQTQIPVYLKFTRTAGTWAAYYSENGKNFIAVGSSFTEGTYFVPKEFGIIAVNNTHGNTNTFDIEFIYFYDSAKASLPGGGIRQIESAVTERIICLGDSLTQGYGVQEIDSFPNKLADLQSAVAVGYDGNVFRSDDGIRTKKVINKGYNGYTTQNIIDNMLQNTILRRDENLTRDIVVLFAGTNDIALGTSAATVYANLTTIIDSLQAEGFEVFVCTLIDRNDLGSGFDTTRAALNTLINSNTAGADGVIDLFADSRLSDASNSTYFQADALHLKSAGNAVIAELIEAAL